MVTFPFCTIPSKRNMSHAIHRLSPFRMRKQSINTLAMSYQLVKTRASSLAYGLELMHLHCRYLLNFAGTLFCCCSFDLSMFCSLLIKWYMYLNAYFFKECLKFTVSTSPTSSTQWWIVWLIYQLLDSLLWKWKHFIMTSSLWCTWSK